MLPQWALSLESQPFGSDAELLRRVLLGRSKIFICSIGSNKNNLRISQVAMRQNSHFMPCAFCPGSFPKTENSLSCYSLTFIVENQSSVSSLKLKKYFVSSRGISHRITQDHLNNHNAQLTYRKICKCV